MPRGFPTGKRSFCSNRTRGGRGRGHAVLTGSGFGNDALLAHALGQQDLPHRVVDFVSAGMEQVFALEINFRTTELRGETFGQIKRRRATDKFGEQLVQLAAEFRILPRRLISLRQFLERRHQRLGDKYTTIGTEVTLGIGLRCDGGGHQTNYALRPVPWQSPDDAGTGLRFALVL